MQKSWRELKRDGSCRVLLRRTIGSDLLQRCATSGEAEAQKKAVADQPEGGPDRLVETGDPVPLLML